MTRWDRLHPDESILVHYPYKIAINFLTPYQFNKITEFCGRHEIMYANIIGKHRWIIYHSSDYTNLFFKYEEDAIICSLTYF